MMIIKIKSLDSDKIDTFEFEEVRVVVNKDHDPRLILTEYYRKESYFSEIPLANIDYIDISVKK